MHCCVEYLHFGYAVLGLSCLYAFNFSSSSSSSSFSSSSSSSFDFFRYFILFSYYSILDSMFSFNSMFVSATNCTSTLSLYSGNVLVLIR